MTPTRLFKFVSGAVAVALFASACAPAATPTPAPATDVPATAVLATAVPATDVPPTAVPPTPEPTAIPLGSAERPIVMAIAPSATTDELVASGNIIADLLSQETGLVIKAVVPTNYKAMIEAMCSGNAQIGWLPPFAYLLANQTKVKLADGSEVNCADVDFVTLRNGLDHYGTQYIGSASIFTTVTDVKDVANLQLLNNLKPCYTDQFSASGYVIPASLLAQEGVRARTAAFVQGHPTVVRAVYAGGICDFGATFIDARTNSAVQADLPDVNDKVIVVYQTDNIIPNDTMASAYDLPQDTRDQIMAALVKVSETEAGKEALRKLYSIDGLKAVDDTFFDEFRVLLAASGIDIAGLVR